MPVWRRLSGRRDAPYRALYPRADHQGSERASEAAAEVACAPDRPPQHMVARPAENEAMEGVARRNDWPQGVAELEAARERGCWQDGRPVGRGFPQPCLQPGYASLIAAGVKTAEGRPGGGWLKTLPQPNDYINFQARVRPRAVARSAQSRARP